MKKITVSILICAATAMYGQNDRPEQFTRDSLEIVKVKLIRPQFRFDNRQTFAGKQILRISGFDVGVLLKEKLRVTLGYYTMSDRLHQFDLMQSGDDLGRLIDLKYGTLNTEIIYFDTRFLSLGMPLEIGAGQNKLVNKNFTTGEISTTQSGAVIFVNFGLSATFKPLRFIGLKGMAGYRKVAYNNVKDYDFNGFFTSIGLNVDLYEVITGVRMYRLKKKYHRGNNISNAVDVLTD